MSYCIMRARKLKTDGNVAASLAHTFRTRETSNADPSRTTDNQHLTTKTPEAAMASYRKKLPEKVRKNGVRAIEYMITYSPDGLKTQQEIADYFNGAIAWLKARHGSSIFHMTLHLDEKTPHLAAYAVPLDDKGKLNCRAFLGGAEKLSAMQTDFWEKAGRKVGLERGIRGSKAKHQEVKLWYAKTKALDVAIEPPRRSFGESDEKYRDRYKAQIAPLVVEAVNARKAEARARAAEESLNKAGDIARSWIDQIGSLTPDQQRALLGEVRELNKENREKRGMARAKKEHGQDKDRGFSR